MSETPSFEVPISFISTRVNEDLLELCNGLKALIKQEGAPQEMDSYSDDLKKRMGQLTAPWWKHVKAQVDEHLEKMSSNFKQRKFREASKFVGKIQQLIERTMQAESPKASQRTMEALREWQSQRPGSHARSRAEQQGEVDEIVEGFKTLGFDTKESKMLKALSRKEDPIPPTQCPVQDKDEGFKLNADLDGTSRQGIYGHDTVIVGAFVGKPVQLEQTGERHNEARADKGEEDEDEEAGEAKRGSDQERSQKISTR